MQYDGLPIRPGEAPIKLFLAEVALLTLVFLAALVFFRVRWAVHLWQRMQVALYLYVAAIVVLAIVRFLYGP